MATNATSRSKQSSDSNRASVISPDLSVEEKLRSFNDLDKEFYDMMKSKPIIDLQQTESTIINPENNLSKENIDNAKLEAPLIDEAHVDLKDSSNIPVTDEIGDAATILDSDKQLPEDGECNEDNKNAMEKIDADNGLDETEKQERKPVDIDVSIVLQDSDGLQVPGIGPKRYTYFYSLVSKFVLGYSYLSDSNLRTSIFEQFSLMFSLPKNVSFLGVFPPIFTLFLGFFPSIFSLFLGVFT